VLGQPARLPAAAPGHLPNHHTTSYGYNPSIAPLSDKWRRLLPGRPSFVASFRLGTNQCHNLGALRLPGNHAPSRVQSWMFLLTANLTLADPMPLQLVLEPTPATALEPRFTESDIGDARWHAVGGDALLLGFVSYVRGENNWRVREATFEVDPASGIVSVRLRSLGHFVAQPGSHPYHVTGRNFAVWPYDNATVLAGMWPGTKLGPEVLATALRAHRPLSDGRILRLLDAAPEARLTFAPWSSDRPLHGNGIMFPISSGTLLLNVVHGHVDSKAGGANFGTHYIHYFTLHDPSPPFRLVGRSKPFCFPVLGFPYLCEIVQFAMSLEADPLASSVDDDDVLLLTYGVNDCESFYVRLRSRNVIAFVLGLQPLQFAP
jgi:hypothetical protein